MSQKGGSILSLLELSEPVDVVDIGANPIDGDPPYLKLLNMNMARVVGFEPNPNGLERLNKKKSENELYLQNAVYDGSQQLLYVCHSQGMTSLLEPDREFLGNFHEMPNWGAVRARIPINTVRLDDVAEVQNMDYLKIDIQGGELEVFKNGQNRLSNCSIIHTEVEFLPLYKNQPLFSEVELFLRGLGFIFHRFMPLVSRVIRPLVVNKSSYSQLNQATWADAVFVRDFTRFNELEPLRLKKIALILHDIYGSFDLALRAMMAIDKKLGTNLRQGYMKHLTS